MRLRLLALAAGILLVADAILLLGVAIARRGAPEAELRLTERELTLPGRDEENAALALRLHWLDPARLRERRTGARPFAKAAYAVLELTPTGLVRADSSRDPAALRARYPDRSRYAIAAAVERNGWVTLASPSVYVPPEYMHVFRGLSRTNLPVTHPRYEVSLCYGRNGDPWICGASRR
jgi:hypothetical protein